MTNEEHIKLLKAQRERAKLKEQEVIEALKINEEPAADPEPAEEVKEVEPDVIADGEVGADEPNKISE